MSVPGNILSGMQQHLAPQPAYAPPAQAGLLPPVAPAAPAPATMPEGVTVAASQRALPTAEQMREPYNAITDPTRAGSAEELIAQQQQGIDPRAQGARLAQARQAQIAQQALERSQYLEQENQRLAQAQQEQAVTLANMQGQLTQVQQPPAPDPLAAYALDASEIEGIGENMTGIQKMMQAAQHTATSAATAEAQRLIAEQQANNQTLLDAARKETQDLKATTEADWNDRFLAGIQSEMGFGLMQMKGDPEWEYFVAQPIPNTGGVTYGQQLVNFINSRKSDEATGIVRVFNQARQERYGAAAQPGAAPVVASNSVRPAPQVGAQDPTAERAALVGQYSKLSDQLGRQEITIPEFQVAAKPIDDRLAVLNGAT